MKWLTMADLKSALQWRLQLYQNKPHHRLGKRHQSEKSIPDKDDASKFWIGENGAQADNGVGTDFHAVIIPAVSKCLPFQLANEMANDGRPKKRPSMAPATVPE
jgi:hypothetical protein